MKLNTASQLVESFEDAAVALARLEYVRDMNPSWSRGYVIASERVLKLAQAKYELAKEALLSGLCQQEMVD